MSQEPTPKVSVIIPTKNGGRRFESVLKAVVNQVTEWPVEVIVIDSGSNDMTLDIARKFASVKILKVRPEDFQHGRTRNIAAEYARGEFIAMITQDAQPVDEFWLRSLVSEIEKDPRIAGVFGRHVAYADASIFTTEELNQHFKAFNVQPLVELSDRARYESDVGYRQFLYFFSDNNALLRKSVWKIHPYPEVDFSEDQAWAKIVLEAGYKKAYCESAVVYHSHNYGLWERFQRSFDESMALEQLFNYGNSSSLLVIPRRWLGLTLRDLKFAMAQSRGSKLRLAWDVSRMAIDNFMRVAGGWLGAHSGFGSPILVAFCSRDKNLKKAKG